MTNPFRSPDAPYDPYATQLVREDQTSTRHPSRFEPRQSTQVQTQADAITATRLHRANALNVNNGDIIVWDAVTYDEKGLFSGSTTTITIPSTGKVSGPWPFHAQVTWPGTGAGTFRQIQILQNNVAIATKTAPVAGLGLDVATTVWNPNRGDQFKVKVNHDAGVPLALTVGIDVMFFECHHPW